MAPGSAGVEILEPRCCPSTVLGTAFSSSGFLFDPVDLGGVPFAPDAIADALRNSGQQVVVGSLTDLGDGRVAFLTAESAQGRDLNKDGDLLDDVLQVLDSKSGVVRNSRRQAVVGSLTDLEGGHVAFLTLESAQGRDWNKDGDLLDEVLQVFDAVRGGVQNSRRQAVAGSLTPLGAGGIAFLTSEAAQDRVLNGDGDKLDEVLQFFAAAAAGRKQPLFG